MCTGDLNYFTCTLGQSALWKQQQPQGTKVSFATVLELIDEQAKDAPNCPALGFADFSRQNRKSTALRQALHLTDLNGLQNKL